MVILADSIDYGQCGMEQSEMMSIRGLFVVFVVVVILFMIAIIFELSFNHSMKCFSLGRLF